MKNIRNIYLKIFFFGDKIISIFLNRHVFVMETWHKKFVSHSHLLQFLKPMFFFSQEHVIYQWKDTTEDLHFSLALLLRDEVMKLSVKSPSDGTLSKYLSMLSSAELLHVSGQIQHTTN